MQGALFVEKSSSTPAVPTGRGDLAIIFHRESLRREEMMKKSYSPNFKAADFDIRVLNDTTRLVEVGNSLMRVIKRLNIMKEDPRYKDMDITYLVVIEGMASKDSYYDNDALSYKRALSLYYLWKRNGISNYSICGK